MTFDSYNRQGGKNPQRDFCVSNLSEKVNREENGAPQTENSTQKGHRCGGFLSYHPAAFVACRWGGGMAAFHPLWTPNGNPGGNFPGIVDHADRAGTGASRNHPQPNRL